MLSGVDDVETREVEILESDVHGLGHGGGVGPLELEPQTPAPMHDEKIELGAGMRPPEMALTPARAELLDDGGQGEPLP